MNEVPAESTNSDSHIVVFIIAVVSGCCYAWLSVRQEFIGNISDAAVYLVLADFLSPFHEAPHELGIEMFYDFAFPPLYPLVLALFGGGTQHAAVSYAITAALMGAAIGAIYWWLRGQRLGTVESLLIATIFGLIPSTLLTALSIQSEPLYVALVFAGFASLDRSSASSQRFGALLVGLSVLARTIGVAALAAICVRWLWQTRGRSRFALPMIAGLPVLLWTAFKAVAGMESSYMHSIDQGTAVETLGFLLDTLNTNAHAAWIGLLSGFDFAGGVHTQIIVVALIGCAVIGWLPRLVRFERDALYVLFYLGLILVWPYPNHMRRFLMVLLPLMLFYGYLAVKRIVLARARVSFERFGGFAYLLAIVLAAAPSSADMINQMIVTRGTELGEFTRSPQWYLQGNPMRAIEAMDRTRELLQSMRGIDEHVPTGACVSSSLSNYIPLYGYRRSQPVPGADIPDAAFRSALQRCPYVFMAAVVNWPPTKLPPMYPYYRLEGELEVIEVTLWDRAQTRGYVLTMLAKVREGEK